MLTKNPKSILSFVGKRLFLQSVSLSVICFAIFSVSVQAQRIAFLSPSNENQNSKAEQFIRDELSKKFKVLDDDLTESVRANSSDLNFYNLEISQAKTFARSAGCNFFIVTKSATLRRASLEKKDYWESYLVVYLVSSRTGRLVYWKLTNAEAGEREVSEKKLLDSLKDVTEEIAAQIKTVTEAEINEGISPRLMEVPAEDSPQAKNFRPPLPFRRLKPTYTQTASLYGIAATVEATVDIDEKGNVTRLEISRWAGYGLDEEVAQVIRQMQWRPGSREGKALPVRVLLRYNFKKIESDN